MRRVELADLQSALMEPSPREEFKPQIVEQIAIGALLMPDDLKAEPQLREVQLQVSHYGAFELGIQVALRIMRGEV